MQQYGEVTEGATHLLRNRIVCNPYVIGECANCNQAYGDKRGNARMQCHVCGTQMCMTCKNDVEEGQNAQYTLCKMCNRYRTPPWQTIPSESDDEDNDNEDEEEDKSRMSSEDEEGDEETNEDHNDRDKDNLRSGTSNNVEETNGESQQEQATFGRFGNGAASDTCRKCGNMRIETYTSGRIC